MSTSQNGYPANDRSLIASYTIPGTAQKVGLRRGDVATVLLYVAARFHREVEPIHVGWCWGYAERNIRGSSTTLSNHASGTAIDLNAPAHPLGTQPTSNYSAAEIARIHSILSAVNHVVRWGGDYTGRKDGMHFEINASPAAVAAVAARIRGGQHPSPVPHVGPTVKGWQTLLEFAPWRRDGLWGSDTDRRSQWMATAARNIDGNLDGSARSTIRTIQRIIDTPDDGIWGPASRARMRVWIAQAQRFLDVDDDGIWGPNTQRAYDAFRRANHRY